MAVTGAMVIDVRDGARIADAAIVIQGERITAAGPAGDVRIPSGARIVDASGKYAIPGLWDVHTHIQNQRELDVFFPLFVAHGIAGIRDAAGEVGKEDLLPQEFRELGKRHPYSPYVVSGGTTWVDGPVPEGTDSAAIVDSLSAEGADYIKIGSMLPRERFLAVVERARQHGLPVAGHLPIAVSATEASDLDLRTMEHTWEILLNVSSREDELRAARLAALSRPLSVADRELELAFPEVEPLLSTWNDGKASALFRKFVENQTWQTPTLVNFAVRGSALSGAASFWNDPSLAFMPKDWVDSWRPERNPFLAGVRPSDVPRYINRMKSTHNAQLELVRRMHEAGVGFLAGTDVSSWNFTVPGVSLHDELEQFVEAGLTPLEALQTATVNPAKYLGMEDTAGAIASGRRADILLLDADPTVDISNTRRIAAVILAGEMIDRMQLDQMLERARQRAAEAGSKESRRDE